MKNSKHRLPFALLITSAIFITDILTPLGVVIGVLYLVVLFYISSYENNRGILLFAGITSVLTLSVFFAKTYGTTYIPWKVLTNRVISVFTILMTAALMLRFRKQEELNLAKIRKSEERFRSLVGSATDAIITADNHGNILTWNRAAERIFGWEQEEVVGKPLTLIMPEKFRAMHTSGMQRYNNTHQPTVIGKMVELEAQRKDGSIFPVELSLGTWEMGELSFFCGIIRDITVRKQLEHELEQANKDLEQKVEERTLELETKNKELEQFVYIASHDLQEPLRSISNFAGLLKDHFNDQLNEHAEQYYRFILDATARMSELIRGLLDYSRLGRKKEWGIVDCNALLNEVQRDLSATIHEKKAVLKTGPLPKLKGYEVELRLLFQNLVGNAIKFGKPGIPPEIHVQARKEDGFWEFSVQDNGIGIDSRHHQKIFQIFQRLHVADDYSGMGIGLAHCKKIVELHGGKIWVDAQPGVGSTFYFTISNHL